MSEISDRRTAGSRCSPSSSVWEAVGISVALMAPSAAVNINPQAAAGTGAVLPAGVRFGHRRSAAHRLHLCAGPARQRFHHAGNSVYGFVGATLGARAGVVAGMGGCRAPIRSVWVTTASAAGILRLDLSDNVGVGGCTSRLGRVSSLVPSCWLECFRLGYRSCSERNQAPVVSRRGHCRPDCGAAVVILIRLASGRRRRITGLTCRC